MTHGQFRALLKEAELSPEQAARRLGISNMTIRRWQRKPASNLLPPFYRRAFQPMFQQMAAEGIIASSPVLGGRDQGTSFQATLRRLGFSREIVSGKGGSGPALLKGLSQIGADTAHRSEVDKESRRIVSFKKLGSEWKEKITGLTAVIRSRDLTLAQKLVAYGALFYLLAPLDLIPDAIPVVGLLDDFAILSLALAFYLRTFPKELKTR